MNNTIVVTEGEGDRLLLEALLSLENHTRIVAAGGRSAANSLARSFLVNGHNVALIVDADTCDPDIVKSGKRFLQHSLADVATRSQWQVFVLVPELEILFFDNRPVLEALIGRNVADTDFVEGQFSPKKTLGKLLQGKGLLQSYREVLPQIDLASLKAAPEIRQLQQFLNSVTQQVAA